MKACSTGRPVRQRLLYRLQQEPGIRVFSDLGFHKVALLHGHAKDLQGNTRDLLVMVHDLTQGDGTFAAQ